MTSAVIIYARGTQGRDRMGKEGERGPSVLVVWSLCFWKVDWTGSSASVSTAMAHMHQQESMLTPPPFVFPRERFLALWQIGDKWQCHCPGVFVPGVVGTLPSSSSV